MSIRLTAIVTRGTKIDQAVLEGISLARRTGVPIEINFDGVSLLLSAQDTVTEKVQEYEGEMARLARRK